MHPVVSIPSLDGVCTRFALQVVLTGTTGQFVVPAATEHIVGEIVTTSDEVVVVIAAVHVVGVRPTIEGVVARLTVQPVGAIAAVEGVVLCAAPQEIMAAVAVEHVSPAS